MTMAVDLSIVLGALNALIVARQKILIKGNKKMEIDTQQHEVSLLDLVVVVAENLKLLILGPVVVGLLALGIGYALPKSFASQAYLSLGESGKAVEAVMRSPAVLDVVLSQFPDSTGGGGGADSGREELGTKFRFSTGSSSQKTGSVLTKLEVEGESPERARALANALIDAWLVTTKPQPESKRELERKLKLNQDALETVAQLIKRLTGETTRLIMPNVQFDLATPTVQLLQLRNGYVDAIASIELQLRGSTRDVVFSPPSAPTKPLNSKMSLIAVLAALGSGFALLLWVFMRQAWKNAAQNPDVAGKQATLRAAVGFRA
jgi:hypothetical protein